ncbi:unnamed protein product [Dibothriocephalus latus]|uniref:BPTI/Kunitz inhibitor domain-containing protein n=1 Tax=Dibothriocephalus latus TaxID=60516 RepID=A0A3P7MCX7_DIBLA|nr:unnamed protein product [Dibothriocephalus latus]
MNPITTVPYGCRAMVERWYFDLKDRVCRSYVTCPAYGNNFPDEDTCISACKPSHIMGEYGTPCLQSTALHIVASKYVI